MNYTHLKMFWKKRFQFFVNTHTDTIGLVLSIRFQITPFANIKPAVINIMVQKVKPKPVIVTGKMEKNVPKNFIADLNHTERKEMAIHRIIFSDNVLL